MNERLRTAMLRSGLDAAALAQAVDVDVKTVSRWLDGRVPHQRTRIRIAQRLGEAQGSLWPVSRPDLAPGSETTSEVLGAWAHRANVPAQLWTGLIANVKQRVDLLGYS
jgi:transcriptional regulator with XRE-family HTH domain